jgi:predicted amidohydrolase
LNALARIATITQGGRFGASVEENWDNLLQKMDQALADRPDLVCLPENFGITGVNLSLEDSAETVPGPTTDAFARKAKENRCYVICPLRTKRDGVVFNSAAVIDREGGILGVYDKFCPVTTSHDYTLLEYGLMPGCGASVFDLDFGRIGIQICFDIGFPENWKALADQGARLVFWPSAYDGGFPLQAYASLHRYYVITSTRTSRSRIIDPLGQVVGETSREAPVLWRDIHLDYVVAHWDFNMRVAERIQAAYGDRVDAHGSDDGNALFLVEPKERGITAAQLQVEFGFESAATYYDRNRAIYESLRSGKTPEPQAALHGDRPQWR